MYVRIPHKVGECLQQRHPYRDAPFPKQPDPDEVATAYGAQRMTAKFAALLKPPVKIPQAIDTLRILEGIYSNPETKNLACSEASIPVSLCALLKHEDDKLRECATHVTATLVSIYQGWKAIYDAGGFVTLANIIQSDPVGAVRIFASKAFHSVALSCQGSLIIANSCPGAVRALVDGLKDPEDSVRLNAANALENVLRIDTAVELALTSGLVSNLLRLIPPTDPLDAPVSDTTVAIRVSALKCASNAVNVTAAKVRWIEEGGVRHLAPLLAHTTPDVRRLAVAILNCISIQHKAKLQESEYCMEGLVDRLVDPNPDTQYTALRALRSVCEHPDARSCLISVLSARKDREHLYELHPTLKGLAQGRVEGLYYSV